MVAWQQCYGTTNLTVTAYVSYNNRGI